MYEPGIPRFFPPSIIEEKEEHDRNLGRFISEPPIFCDSCDNIDMIYLHESTSKAAKLRPWCHHCLAFVD